jgi:hypothetical protein
VKTRNRISIDKALGIRKTQTWCFFIVQAGAAGILRMVIVEKQFSRSAGSPFNAILYKQNLYDFKNDTCEHLCARPNQCL